MVIGCCFLACIAAAHAARLREDGSVRHADGVNLAFADGRHCWAAEVGVWRAFLACVTTVFAARLRRLRAIRHAGIVDLGLAVTRAASVEIRLCLNARSAGAAGLGDI